MDDHKIWDIVPRISTQVTEAFKTYSPLASQLLHNRGINSNEEADKFLSRGQDLLEDPLLLPDMPIVIERIKHAINKRELIAIFGDFDADGTTGTALMAEGLERLGANVIPYIPHRTAEGHGLNEEAINFLRNKGTSLIITVDCGVSSFKEIEYANSLGIDIIITDHHPLTGDLPDALAIVNPNIESSSYPFRELAGVGLALKLIQALSSDFGIAWDERLLQMAALGTITDVTPLVGENRYIVSAGLDSMNKDPLPGILELLRLGRQPRSKVDTESISFVIGPRINAAGRLDHAITSYNLLRANSKDEAYPIAQELDRLNQLRREITSDSMIVAMEKIKQFGKSTKIIVIWDHGFSPGIAGLIASRLCERYYRPSIVISLENGIGRGSARSIPEFDISLALTQCNDILISGGGHPRAAGFSIYESNLQEFVQRLNYIANESLKDINLNPTIVIDAHVNLSTLSDQTLQFIEMLRPYGERNPEPIFITKGIEILDITKVGMNGQHIKFKLKQINTKIEAIAFNQMDYSLGIGDQIDAVYKLGTNRWQGKDETQLIIEDFRKSDSN